MQPAPRAPTVVLSCTDVAILLRLLILSCDRQPLIEEGIVEDTTGVGQALYVDVKASVLGIIRQFEMEEGLR